MRLHAVAISVLAIAISRESKADKTAGNYQITLFHLIFYIFITFESPYHKCCIYV